MKKLFIPIILSTFLFTSCSLMGIPIPEDKQDFIGTWKDDEVHLTISPTGQLEYKDPKLSLDAPIKEFTDEHIIAGVWFLEKTFRIDNAPYQKNGVWKMKINGIELTKGIEVKLSPLSDDPNQELLDYLYDNIEEIQQLEQRLMTYAEPDVSLTMYVEAEPDPNSKYIYDQDYYRIYVGEDHQGTRQVNVYRFLIHKDTREILHLNPITFEPESLDQWRKYK